jgi:3-hydroxy acid dehydrogenase / malonic semialdehyde reductase
LPLQGTSSCFSPGEWIAWKNSNRSLAVPVHIVRLDVRDRQSVERTLSSLPPEFSEIDILLNNAGLSLGLEPAYQTDLDDWETMVDTNIKGLMYFTRLVLPGMVERNRGHIINLGSIAASYPYPGGMFTAPPKLL